VGRKGMTGLPRRTNTHGHGTPRTRAAHSRLQQGLQRDVRLGVRARRLRREPMRLENLVDSAPLSHMEGSEHTGAVLGWGWGGRSQVRLQVANGPGEDTSTI
jgi:hypothetical protein